MTETLLTAANRLECIRVHWGARRRCTESIDGRELCSSCKVRVMVNELSEIAVRPNADGEHDSCWNDFEYCDGDHLRLDNVVDFVTGPRL